MGWRWWTAYDPLSVAFDDQCPICQRAKRVSGWLRRSPQLVLLDSADRPAHPLLAKVPHERRLATLHAATATAVVHGFVAVAAVIRRSWLWPWLYPGVVVGERTGLGDWIYQQVNTRRRRCGDGCQSTQDADEAKPARRQSP